MGKLWPATLSCNTVEFVVLVSLSSPTIPLVFSLLPDLHTCITRPNIISSVCELCAVHVRVRVCAVRVCVCVSVCQLLLPVSDKEGDWFVILGSLWLCWLNVTLQEGSVYIVQMLKPSGQSDFVR